MNDPRIDNMEQYPGGDSHVKRTGVLVKNFEKESL